MSSPIAKLYTDTAGSTILSPGATNVFVNNSPVALMGDKAQGHGQGAHAGPSILTGSNNVFVNNKQVARLNDVSTCGHTVITSSNVTAG